jgi:kynurenine formamidase
MKISRVVDLSHPLHPGDEPRRLEIRRIPATNITGAPSELHWYVMHWIMMGSHIGTHLETPYHALREGADLAKLSVQQLVGQAVILDLRSHAASKGISLETVQHAAEQAEGVGRDDIVLCMTGWSRYYGEQAYNNPPFLTGEAVGWLVDQGIKMLGIDTNGNMDPASHDRQNHLPIFRAGVTYIENLTNLEAIGQNRATVVALPLAIAGLEAIPTRVIALL